MTYVDLTRLTSMLS